MKLSVSASETHMPAGTVTAAPVPVQQPSPFFFACRHMLASGRLLALMLAGRCAAYSSGAGSCTSAMRGHGPSRLGDGGYALTLSQPCEKHASCHKTEFCSVEGCDKCRYCLHGSDSINKRCPCGPGRKSAKPTDVAATAAASEQAARVEQRAKLRNGRGKPVRNADVSGDAWGNLYNVQSFMFSRSGDPQNALDLLQSLDGFTVRRMIKF